MTGCHRSVVVRALSMSAPITAIRPADTRSGKAQTRIMPPGNAITGSPGCGRASLWSNLRDAGLTRFAVNANLPLRSRELPVARAWR